MKKIFGIPIFMALFLGYFYPYNALAFSRYGFIILCIMMTSAALEIKWTVINVITSNIREIFTGIFFIFLFFPLMQWFFSKILINDESLAYGTLLASLCPLSIVAPSFTQMHNGDEDLSILLMIASIILFPLAVYFALLLTHQTMYLRPIIIDMILLIIIPIVLSGIIKFIDHKYYHQRLVSNWKKVKVEFNMLAISLLAFIYLGSSVSKLNLSYTPIREILAIITVLFFQDFGVYFISQWTMRQFFSKEKALALSISLSMKNIAVSGAILLFYDPKASLASAIGFLVHALFFNYLIIIKPTNE